MRIFDIINSSLNLREDDDVLVRDLKRGIRKAMNEFYRGPVNNDAQARITALLHENAALRNANESMNREIAEVHSSHSTLLKRLQRARDVLDEFPDEGGEKS